MPCKTSRESRINRTADLAIGFNLPMSLCISTCKDVVYFKPVLLTTWYNAPSNRLHIVVSIAIVWSYSSRVSQCLFFNTGVINVFIIKTFYKLSTIKLTEAFFEQSEK